jgi:hypothetical protein
LRFAASLFSPGALAQLLLNQYSKNSRKQGIEGGQRRGYRKAGQFFMSDNQGETQDNERSNHVDPWVQSQLSAHHLQWLEKQKEVVNPTEILKYALAEWVIRHPEQWFGEANVGIAIRSALEEFIARHKEEFISTE